MSVLGVAARTAQKMTAKSGIKKCKKNPAPELPKGVYDKIDAPVSEYFSVGFASEDVMPDDIGKKKYYVAGYKIRNPATGVLDPMTASAIWIDDNSGRGGVVFVSSDNVGVSSYDINRIKAELADFCKETGCRSINICSTHNHAGIDTLGYWGPLPKTGKDPKFMRIFYDGVKKAVKRAYEDAREGSLYVGSIEAPPIQRDSRLPEVYSKTLTRFRFVPNDGGREIWMLNFASHSESLLGANSLVSADFPCYVREEIKNKAGADCIYFVGAIGGLIRLKELDEDNIKSTKMAGEQLGQAAIAINNDRKLPPMINLLRQEYYSEVDNFVLLLAEKIGIFKSSPAAIGNGGTHMSIHTEMTYVNIGGFQMLLLPCEIFPELVYGGYLSADETAEGKSPDINPKTLVEIAGDEDLLIFGLSNDEIGYVVPPNDFYLNPEEPYISGVRDRLDRRHYEETNSLGPKTAQTLADTFEGIMKTVRAE